MIFGALIIAWLAMGLPTLGASERNFAGITKMFAFRLIASSDLPMVQLLIACFVGWLRSNRSPARIRTPALESEPDLLNFASDESPS